MHVNKAVQLLEQDHNPYLLCRRPTGANLSYQAVKI